MTTEARQREPGAVDADGTLDHLQRRLAGILEHSPDAISVKDTSGRYLLCNARFCDWLGVTQREVIGRTAGEILKRAETVEEVEAQDRQVLRDRKSTRAIREFHCEDDRRWVEVLKFPILDDRGNVAAIGTIGRDVTDARCRERVLAASEQRYKAFIADTGEAIWHLRFDPPVSCELEADVQARLILERAVFAECNAVYAATYAYDGPDQIIGRRYADVVPPGNDDFLDFWRAFVTGGYRFSELESSKVGLDGRRRDFVKNGHGVVEDGKLVRAWGSERDVSEQRRAERRLLESERRFRVLYDENPSMYFTLGADGRIRSVNRYGAEQLGYRAQELVGMPGERLHHHDDRGIAMKSLQSCLREPDRTHRWEIRKLRRDGSTVWVRETARAITDTDGSAAILSVCEDTSEARQLSRELSYQATHDALTGLVNRREFERRLNRVLDTAQREGSEHGLFYMDLDQFKVVNDTCGHAAGDQLLKQVAGVMLERVRKRDTLARLGGDEFGVLIEHCPLSQAERVAREIADAVEEFRFVWEGKLFAVGVSVGLVVLDATARSVSDVLAAADSACYAAKDRGRNRIHVYRVDDVEMQQRRGEMQWVAGINAALDAGRLRLARQRIAPLSSAAPDGEHFELLLRLETEEGDIIPPGAFLPAAERFNLSARLDRWVVEHAVAWLVRDPVRLRGIGLCSVNLSGQSLGDPGFLGFLEGLLDRTGVPGEKICLEITETAAIAHLTQAVAFIDRLSARGVKFALDDFGSGLSSFAYLKRLPVDFLKIDGLFVKDIVDDPIDCAMVRSITEIAKVTGKHTIAEFVESSTIVDRLREIGVDYAQGYAVGRPELIDHQG